MPGAVAAAAGSAVPAALLPPASRGRTVVSDGVIAKLASQAALEVDGASPTSRRFTLPGRTVRPQVSAAVDGHLARLTVTVAMDYPVAIRPLAGAVRRQVQATLRRLAGVDAREIDVVIGSLRAADAAHGRVR